MYHLCILPWSLGFRTIYIIINYAFCLNASSVTIWKDVPGVLNADPRVFKSTTLLENLSYTEAIELAYFGAKVIHPKTMAPAIAASIPIYIKNTFDPDSGGTRIFLPAKEVMREKCVCGFSTVDNVALLNIGSEELKGNEIIKETFQKLNEIKNDNFNLK